MKWFLLGVSPLVFAQTDPATPADPWSIIATFGGQVVLAGVFWLMWQREQAKRDKAEERERALYVKMVDDITPLLVRVADALHDSVSATTATVEKVSAPSVDAQALDLATRRLELAIDELRSRKGSA